MTVNINSGCPKESAIPLQNKWAYVEYFPVFRKLWEVLYICSLSGRALSSAGSEHLPYKEGVVGSNPTGPTISTKEIFHQHQRTSVAYPSTGHTMAVTRLKRKVRKNRTKATQRKATMKRLLATPVIKNVNRAQPAEAPVL
jgi:hypothetical protein